MEQIQLLRLCVLCVLTLRYCLAVPLGSQCVDECFCTGNLQDYFSQLVNLPHRINERSVAPWSYRENIDLDRVPQIIHEANCHTSHHSCRGLDMTSSLETIPILLRVPILRRNANCFPKASYSIEFETFTIACLCATPKTTGLDSL